MAGAAAAAVPWLSRFPSEVFCRSWIAWAEMSAELLLGWRLLHLRTKLPGLGVPVWDTVGVGAAGSSVFAAAVAGTGAMG